MNQPCSHSRAFVRIMVDEHRNSHSYGFFVCFVLFVLRHLRYKNVLLE